jgi:hypothetical protein
MAAFSVQVCMRIASKHSGDTNPLRFRSLEIAWCVKRKVFVSQVRPHPELHLIINIAKNAVNRRRSLKKVAGLPDLALPANLA